MKKLRLYFCIASLSLCSCFQLVAQSWTALQKESAPPVDHGFFPNNWLGWAVDMNEQYAVVGAPQQTYRGTLCGVVYLFERIDGQWKEIAVLYPSDGLNSTKFGVAVDIDGDQIIVGATGRRAAYVFEKPEGGWTTMSETAKLQVSGLYAGQDVKILGDMAAIGATEGLFLFVRPEGGWQNSSEPIRLTNTINLHFGDQLALQEDLVVAGGQFNGLHNGAAGVYIYEKPPGGWRDTTETARIVPESPLISMGNVAIHNDVLAVISESSGKIHVYEKPADGWKSDTFDFVLSNGGGILSRDLEINDHGILASTNKQGAFFYPKPESGWHGDVQPVLLKSPTTDYNDGAGGRGLAMTENEILMGAIGFKIDDEKAGTVYSFVKPATGWADSDTPYQQFEFSTDVHNKNAYFGTLNGVAIDGNTAIVGAPRSTGGTNFRNFGSAYVYEFSNDRWDHVATLRPSTTTIWGFFGEAVAIRDNHIVVGTGNRDNKVYIYEKPATGWRDTTESAILLNNDEADLSVYSGNSLVFNG
ncbi:MAG: FG-GAP repeat protein, partial [Bacteroidota bacterium]